MHEISLHEENCFITLTYNPEHYPESGSLDITHFQKFMKRLRKKSMSKIRFYHCGEYGDQLGRPHYHAILFGYDFNDKKLYKQINGRNLYTSQILSEIWGKGFCTVGTATFESACYVARYLLKKQTGPTAEEYYSRVDPETGEVLALKPEYTTMSRRPGIGSNWFKQFKTDVYPEDEMVVNGVKTRPPKYYDTQYEISDPQEFENLKNQRIRKSIKYEINNTPDRLAVRETILKSKINTLPRK